MTEEDCYTYTEGEEENEFAEFQKDSMSPQEAIQKLQEMFPGVKKKVIVQYLENSGFVFFDALASLGKMNQDSNEASPNSSVYMDKDDREKQTIAQKKFFGELYEDVMAKINDEKNNKASIKKSKLIIHLLDAQLGLLLYLFKYIYDNSLILFTFVMMIFIISQSKKIETTRNFQISMSINLFQDIDSQTIK